jgi:proteasome accessory factor B
LGRRLSSLAESKTERLLQIVLCLTQGRRFVTKDQLRDAIPDYADCPTTEAFERMFERDKNELRELGIPLETGPTDSPDEDPGYRVDRDAYALPAIQLTRDEMTAVALAARVWHQPAQASAAARALLKLGADGADVREDELPPIDPRLSGGEGAFEPLTTAVAQGRTVRFGYRGSGSDVETTRHLQPWGVVSQRGRWYLVGYDLDRRDERVFRLSRISTDVTTEGPARSFEVPADVELRSRVEGFVEAEGPTLEARLLVATGSGHGLRRRAIRIDPGTDGERDLLVVGYTDERTLASEIASYGPSVLVDDPPGLRTAVVGILRSALDAQERSVGVKT